MPTAPASVAEKIFGYPGYMAEAEAQALNKPSFKPKNHIIMCFKELFFSTTNKKH
ncbi:hypothetical protein C900_00848 [Fulvivirga imtechensis AK7]|uniref:Uncharacterized protein n=1 Tax=Fulvivirga imtechensis AK7 TaxID=1237149 RepID=L8K088_9BACT|nr:hypothetical protein C900_00848 [Fulvivirga imtechensis AK7]